MMNGLVEKLQREIEKGQAEQRMYEENVRLAASDPANAVRLREAKKFHRKVGTALAALGAATLATIYVFFFYTGDLYLVLGLLGAVALGGGLYQIVVGKAQ